jgi:hypothetical protein
LPTIEVALHERVERARIEYEMAIAEAQKLLEAAQQSTDGVSAIRRARHLQQTATQEYSEALRALTEFVLGRKAG